MSGMGLDCHVSSTLLPHVPNTDEPAVPEDGDGAELGAGGGAWPIQVSPLASREPQLWSRSRSRHTATLTGVERLSQV